MNMKIISWQFCLPQANSEITLLFCPENTRRFYTPVSGKYASVWSYEKPHHRNRKFMFDSN